MSTPTPTPAEIVTKLRDEGIVLNLIASALRDSSFARANGASEVLFLVPGGLSELGRSTATGVLGNFAEEDPSKRLPLHEILETHRGFFCDFVRAAARAFDGLDALRRASGPCADEREFALLHQNMFVELGEMATMISIFVEREMPFDKQRFRRAFDVWLLALLRNSGAGDHTALKLVAKHSVSGGTEHFEEMARHVSRGSNLSQVAKPFIDYFSREMIDAIGAGELRGMIDYALILCGRVAIRQAFATVPVVAKEG